MQFGFYPGHESGCGNPRECPHLGGASVGYLVHIVNTSEDSRLYVHRQLDAERERNSRPFAENQKLEKKIEQLKLELRLERQNKFATNKQKANSSPQGSATTPEPEKPAGKRGAPQGHVGWYRKTPTQNDIRVDVGAPSRCPHCDSRSISTYSSQPATEHLKKDIIDGRYHVTLFTHPAARCRNCRRWVQ